MRERGQKDAKSQKKLYIIKSMDGYFWLQDWNYMEPESQSYFCSRQCILRASACLSTIFYQYTIEFNHRFFSNEARNKQQQKQTLFALCLLLYVQVFLFIYTFPKQCSTIFPFPFSQLTPLRFQQIVCLHFLLNN